MSSKIEKKRKQEFLYEQIISQNHSAENFAAFLGESKPNGTDVDAWTLEELKVKVSEFVKLPSSIDVAKVYAEVKVTQGAHLEIFVAVGNSPRVKRTLDELLFVFSKLSDECPSISVMKPFPKSALITEKGDRIRPEMLPILELGLAHLVSFRSAIRSPTLENFLTASDSDWNRVFRSYQAPPIEIEKVFGAFSLAQLSKNKAVPIDSFFHHKMFPENVYAYINTNQKVLSGIGSAWGRIDGLLQKLSRSIIETSNVLKDLEKAFEEMFHQFKNQNAVFRHREEELSSLIQVSQQLMANWSVLAKNQAAKIGPTFQVFADFLKKRHSDVSSVG